MVLVYLAVNGSLSLLMALLDDLFVHNCRSNLFMDCGVMVTSFLPEHVTFDQQCFSRKRGQGQQVQDSNGRQTVNQFLVRTHQGKRNQKTGGSKPWQSTYYSHEIADRCLCLVHNEQLLL